MALHTFWTIHSTQSEIFQFVFFPPIAMNIHNGDCSADRNIFRICNFLSRLQMYLIIFSVPPAFSMNSANVCGSGTCGRYIQYHHTNAKWYHCRRSKENQREKKKCVCADMEFIWNKFQIILIRNETVSQNGGIHWRRAVIATATRENSSSERKKRWRAKQCRQHRNSKRFQTLLWNFSIFRCVFLPFYAPEISKRLVEHNDDNDLELYSCPALVVIGGCCGAIWHFASSVSSLISDKRNGSTQQHSTGSFRMLFEHIVATVQYFNAKTMMIIVAT